jgi:hypothetical protein
MKERAPAEGFAVESMPCQDGKTEILGERSPRMNLRLVSVAIALVFSAMLLGTGVYQNVVDAPTWVLQLLWNMPADSTMQRTQGCFSDG